MTGPDDRRRLVGAILIAVASSTAVAACDVAGGDADDGREPDATLSSPDTLVLRPSDATIPEVSLSSEAVAFVDEVLADGSVTADELTAAYTSYLECVAAGGGTGRYAYDIDLRTGLVVEWQAGDDDVDRDLLSASCSSRFLGDLTRRFARANPPPDDLAGRQRASIAACVGAVSPQAAANLPEQISIGTAGEASSVGELQLDPAALDPDTLGSDPATVAAVSDCIASVGVAWQPFG